MKSKEGNSEGEREVEDKRLEQWVNSKKKQVCVGTCVCVYLSDCV